MFVVIINHWIRKKVLKFQIVTFNSSINNYWIVVKLLYFTMFTSLLLLENKNVLLVNSYYKINFALNRYIKQTLLYSQWASTIKYFSISSNLEYKKDKYFIEKIHYFCEKK